MEHSILWHSMAAGEPSGLVASGADGDFRSAQNTKILIVSVSESSRCSVEAALRGLEYESIRAAATSEAITAISLHRVDLVIIDLLVPELGATEFCRMVKKAKATQLLPVFVIGATEDLESEVRAIEAGADEYFVAPLRPRAFRARVEAGLRHKAMIDSLDDSETVLFSLAQSVEERDPALGSHCERLAFMTVSTGLVLGLPAHELQYLERGAYLHDVGKVAIPDQILFKPGPLTPEEWEIMKSHAERGERICRNMRSLAPILPIIRHHHEKWDGTGYPDGISGEEIPLLARILQLADIYDALTTARPYKRALSQDQALAVMREEVKRGWRDPQLMEVFSQLVPMFERPMPADFSRLSLEALAASVERFRVPGMASIKGENEDRRRPSRPLLVKNHETIKLTGGL